jgi:hypothetical protein
MDIPWQGLQGFSGATAIGALVFVDLALVANSFANNLFPVIQDYSKTQTWAIVVAIPVISLAYLLGVLSIGTSELMLIWVRALDAKTLVEDTIAVTGKGEYAAARFQQIRQEAEMLAGGTIAFALLALGAALYAWKIAGWRRFLTAVAIMAFLLAVASVLLCLYRYRMAHRQAVATKT